MTSQSARMNRRQSTRRPGRAIASFPTYRDAERAVDYLSDNGFPVERTAIIGRGLHYVEKVTGRMGLGRAALQGALTGAMVGLLVGWLFAIFDWFDPVVSRLWLVIDGLWFGALVGATMGLVMHLMLRGERDFSSIGGLEADTYEVVVEDEVADEAARLLAQMTGSAGTSSGAGSAGTSSGTVAAPDTTTPAGATARDRDDGM